MLRNVGYKTWKWRVLEVVRRWGRLAGSRFKMTVRQVDWRSVMANLQNNRHFTCCLVLIGISGGSDCQTTSVALRLSKLLSHLASCIVINDQQLVPLFSMSECSWSVNIVSMVSLLSPLSLSLCLTYLTGHLTANRTGPTSRGFWHCCQNRTRPSTIIELKETENMSQKTRIVCDGSNLSKSHNILSHKNTVSYGCKTFSGHKHLWQSVIKHW